MDEDLNRMEGNTAQLRTDLDTHTAATAGVHGATSAATANRLVIRDASGRAKFAAPSASDDAARKQEVDAVQTTLTNHIADYVRQPGYATASGSANAYSVTLNPAPTAYVDGMAVAVKINTTNTGASTLNVNGLGAKAIKRANGLDVAAGMLKAGSIVTLRYNASTGNFILQGEGSDILPLYIAGVEYVPWVQGYKSGSPILSKKTDNLYIAVDDTSDEGTWVTDVPVDLTNINYIFIEFMADSDAAPGSYLIVSDQKMGNMDTYTARVSLYSSATPVQKLNVSGLSGSYYVRICRRGLSTTLRHTDVYRIIASP